MKNEKISGAHMVQVCNAWHGLMSYDECASSFCNRYFTVQRSENLLFKKRVL